MTPIIAFYSGQDTDSEGRSLRDIRCWDFNRLEVVHDYIQWLFPLRTRSAFNLDAPLLDEETIRGFLEGDALRLELLASLEQMLAFYGFVLHEENGRPAVATGPDWETRRRHWLHPGNHNLLRVTRILTCLGTLGLAEHARAFLAALEQVCADAPGLIGERTLNFSENRPSVIDPHAAVHWLTSHAGLIALAVLVVVALAALATQGGVDMPYVAAPALLTPAERAFFAVLRQAVGHDFLLFAKVRLGDILQIEEGVSGKRRFAAFGRISSKHADFVLCDARSFAVVGVIELDDHSHQRRDRQERDRFFDAALAKANIPVLRVPARRTYDIRALREDLHAIFEDARRG